MNILAKAKQQLIECDICNFQTKGGNSNLTGHNKTSKHIKQYKKERGTTIDDIRYTILLCNQLRNVSFIITYFLEKQLKDILYSYAHIRICLYIYIYMKLILSLNEQEETVHDFLDVIEVDDKTR